MPINYKRHIIVAGASRSSQTADTYIPVAYIAWEITGTERRSHAMVPTERFPSFEEATAFALQAAKAWVDRHFQDSD